MHYTPENLTAILETARRYQQWGQLRNKGREVANEGTEVQATNFEDDFQLISPTAFESMQLCQSLEELGELMRNLVPVLVEEKMAGIELELRKLIATALGTDKKNAWYISYDDTNQYWHVNRHRDGVQRVHTSEQGKNQGVGVKALIIDTFTPLRNLDLCRVHLPELYWNYIQRLLEVGQALAAGELERGSHLFNRFLDLDRQMRAAGFSNHDRQLLFSACRRLNPGLQKYLTLSFGQVSEE